MIIGLYNGVEVVRSVLAWSTMDGVNHDSDAGPDDHDEDNRLIVRQAWLAWGMLLGLVVVVTIIAAGFRDGPGGVAWRGVGFPLLRTISPLFMVAVTILWVEQHFEGKRVEREAGREKEAAVARAAREKEAAVARGELDTASVLFSVVMNDLSPAIDEWLTNQARLIRYRAFDSMISGPGPPTNKKGSFIKVTSIPGGDEQRERTKRCERWIRWVGEISDLASAGAVKEEASRLGQLVRRNTDDLFGNPPPPLWNAAELDVLVEVTDSMTKLIESVSAHYRAVMAELGGEPRDRGQTEPKWAALKPDEPSNRADGSREA